MENKEIIQITLLHKATDTDKTSFLEIGETTQIIHQDQALVLEVAQELDTYIMLEEFQDEIGSVIMRNIRKTWH